MVNLHCDISLEVMKSVDFSKVKFAKLAKVNNIKEEDTRKPLFHLILAFLNSGNQECLQLFVQTAGKVVNSNVLKYF